MKVCTLCGLHEGRSQVVVGDYASRKGSICFIGEAPGYNEDKQGHPFVGRSGKLLEKMLENIEISRSEVSILNIIKCRPPNNRTPTNTEMKICGNLWLKTQIQLLQPKLLVTLGSVALRYFFPNTKMTASKGKLLESEFGPLLPLFHPSYILRQGNTLIDAYFNDFVNMKNNFVEFELISDFNVPSTRDDKKRGLNDFF